MIKSTTKTYEKLKEISNTIYNEFGIEAINFDNLLPICQKTGKKLGYNMAWKTYKEHINKIIGIIKQLDFENQLNKVPEYIGANQLLSDEKEKVAEPEKELLSIKFIYSDGSYEIRELKPKVIEKIEPEQIWLGLFNYKKDGTIIIQKGRYIGCNVKNTKSIKSYFKSISWFYKWSLGQIEKAEKEQIIITPDTPKDVEILKKIVERIETSMNLN